MNPQDVTLVVRPGGSDAAVYVNGVCAFVGHTEDVMERLVERLGITVRYAEFITDREAPGWSGAAPTLAALAAHITGEEV